MPQDFLPPTSGRVPDLGLIFTHVRDLTHEDLLRLAHEGREVRASTPPLQRIRAAHHRAARLLAEGKSQKDVALLVSRTPARIHQLMLDPAFKELVFYYESQKTELEIELQAQANLRAIEVHESAMIEIQERLEDEIELKKIPISELRQLAQFTGDRTVLPPKVAQPAQSVPNQITFNIAGPNLRPEAEVKPKTIEHDE